MNLTFATIGGIQFHIINGKQLVPMFAFLSKSAFNSSSKYYFEPSTNKVFSGATGTLRELGGTRSTSVANRGETVWTFVNSKFSFTEITTAFANYVRNNSYSYGYNLPKSGAKMAATSGPSQRSSVSNLSTKGNVIIGTIGVNGTISFSSSPFVHTNEQSWKTEIERLAQANPGTRYVAVEVVGSVVAGGLVWS